MSFLQINSHDETDVTPLTENLISVELYQLRFVLAFQIMLNKLRGIYQPTYLSPTEKSKNSKNRLLFYFTCIKEQMKIQPR